nr:hypothetical protein [uncultured Ruegeria sp.]
MAACMNPGFEKGKGVRCADAVFARILADTPDALPVRSVPKDITIQLPGPRKDQSRYVTLNVAAQHARTV